VRAKQKFPWAPEELAELDEAAHLALVGEFLKHFGRGIRCQLRIAAGAECTLTFPDDPAATPGASLRAEDSVASEPSGPRELLDSNSAPAAAPNARHEIPARSEAAAGVDASQTSLEFQTC